jgi:protein TonB
MRKSSASKLAVITAVGICLGAAGALAAGDEPVRWEKGCGLSEPKLVEKVAPVYPEAAREERVEGVVVLEVTITAAGDVTAIQTIEDPDARLTAAAREAVARWRFEPARDDDGDAAAVRYRLTVSFRLS